MKTIKLFVADGAWMADFIGDAEVESAFGTTIIPTAWTAKAPRDMVIEALRNLNPTAQILVA